MFKSLLRDKVLIFLAFFAVCLKYISLNKIWIEKYYTYGFYPLISKTLRFLFGWIPFSIGDLFYLFVFIYLVVKLVKMIRLLKKRQMKQYLSWILLKKVLRLVLYIYIIFNVFWGLNYNRQGIAAQLQLNVLPYNITDLTNTLNIIVAKLNQNATGVDSVYRTKLNKNRVMFHEGIAAYSEAVKKFPFLHYEVPSLKPSFYSHIGHFFGFTGYYNPFSGEAQIKTTVPFVIKPFVTTHEMGHQLGYGKENEANFVSYLACKSSKNVEFRYSVYFEMYRYAYRDLYNRDSLLALSYKAKVHPQVLKDAEKLKAYSLRTSNMIAPLISIFYDEFLKMNAQPKGTQTYNEVVAWLIAYQKKYGLDAL